MKKRLRQKVTARKNFFPTLVFTLVLWAGVAATVYFLDPQATGSVLLFFLVVFSALLFTLSILFANTRRGVVVALALTAFLVLRYFGIGNILNLLLIAGITLSVEYYLSRA